MKKANILELRERLDKALAVPDLVHEESIRSLVKDQLLRSSFSDSEGAINFIAEKRATDVSNFLHMLRSASGKEHKPFEANGIFHNEWKVKQDTNELRVLYREGPHGTPFHTLLVEGYVDGPIDVCLCVSWETILYKKWWPQFNIPTFKIAMSTSLQKVRIGEEINLIRVKVPWPVSDREALLHYFEIEYLKEDLVLVLLNTISDTEQIDYSTHGFTRAGIPEAKDIVRVDLLGGFVLQKVSSNRSYFRTVVNMDIKLDFVPPALINFISRQLIGSGYKLYQKAVATVGTSDEDYREALKGLMYVRLREGLDSLNKATTLLDMNGERHTIFAPEETTIKTGDDIPAVINRPITTEMERGGSEQSTLDENQVSNGTRDEIPAAIATSITSEIEEESERSISMCLEENQLGYGSSTPYQTMEELHVIEEKAVSPEVRNALDILDKAIAVVRGLALPDNHQTDSSPLNHELQASNGVMEACCIHDMDASEVEYTTKLVDEPEGQTPANDATYSGAASTTRGVSSLSGDRFLVLGYQEENGLKPSNGVNLEAGVTTTQPAVVDSTSKVSEESSRPKANGSHLNGSYSNNAKLKRSRKKKRRICCFSLS